MDDVQSLLKRIRACRLCEADLDRPPNPVLRASRTASVLIAGQAPGNLADVSAKPFTDPSGVRLRSWMSVSDEEFYDESRIAIVPMGFCFPGYDGKGGDRPPLKICAPTWRRELLGLMPNVKLTLAIGGYAQRWHLEGPARSNLTEKVKAWREYLKRDVLPLPHPSWRNNAWLKRNPWFEDEVLPELRTRLRALIE